MDEIFKTVDALIARCDGLEAMDLEAVQELMDSLQECFIDMLGVEPKKAKKESHKRWKGKLKELSTAVSRAEAREEQLYDIRHPMLKHYCQLMEQPYSEREWVKLKKEIDQWLSQATPETAAEFDMLGYQEMLEECCRGLDMEEEPEGPASLEQYSPIPCFMQYLPLIYKVDELWENFQLYIRSAFPDKEENFFAFQRSDEAMAIWAQAIADMGGGIPPSIFASAVFLIQRYRELGHDLDRELAELS
ncbi:MAG: hypothetical protein ACI4O0_07355 [Candidatus Limivicinus sp.]